MSSLAYIVAASSEKPTNLDVQLDPNQTSKSPNLPPPPGSTHSSNSQTHPSHSEIEYDFNDYHSLGGQPYLSHLRIPRDDSTPFYESTSSPYPSLPDSGFTACNRNPSYYSKLSEMITDKFPQWRAFLPWLPKIPKVVDSFLSVPSTSHLYSWKTSLPSYLKSFYAVRSQTQTSSGHFSPPATANLEQQSKGMVAYLLAASGEDVRPRGLTISAFGEIYQNFKIALPLAHSNLTQFLMMLISIGFCARLGLNELASSSLAFYFAKTSGFIILNEFSGTLNSLIQKCIISDEHYWIQLYIFEMFFFLLVISVPICALWSVFGIIFYFLFGSNYEISSLTQQFLLCLIPSLLSHSAIYSLSNFMEIQEKYIHLEILSTCVLLLHAAATWLFFDTFDLGFMGCALSYSLSCFLNALFLFSYFFFLPEFVIFRSEIKFPNCSEIKNTFVLGYSAVIISCLENWPIYLLIFLSGLFSNPEIYISVTAIILSAFSLSYSILSAFGTSISVRVGNELGAGRPRSAKHSALAGLFICILLGLLLSLLLYFSIATFAQALTSSDDVLTHISNLTLVITMLVLVDSLQKALLGVVKGCGFHSLGAVITFLSHIIGLSFGCFMAFYKNFSIEGLFFGVLCAYVLQCILLSYVTLSSDWGDQAVKAIRRVESRYFSSDEFVSFPSISGELLGMSEP